ncbi:A-kinase anchor protein 6 [Arapaima gigas]
MSITVSPMASEATSPMITSVTPTLDPCNKVDQMELGESRKGDRAAWEQDSTQCHQKPPPLHTGADWKVVLHLPEIEMWLRGTTDRVRDLTHSVHQDTLNKHVDVHLVQLKDICEDISDHVEQIHALLETEFSLKLLSYSVNIIVDIRTVQLLWHQLRVSVLVLKERLLQGLQDSNGNYTRQTNILQAFSQDHDEARLGVLTEVDDSGQLTIKCSQDYFSLDCGITAFELSDYSPGEEPEGHSQAIEPQDSYRELEENFPELIQSADLLKVAAKHLSSQHSQETTSKKDLSITGSETAPEPTCKNHTGKILVEESPSSSLHNNTLQTDSAPSKRPLQHCLNCNKVSPTQLSPAKKCMYPEDLSLDNTLYLHRQAPQNSLLQFQVNMSRSTPSLLDLPDRSKFWLDLSSVYPNAISQSYESLQVMNDKNQQANREAPSCPSLYRRSSESGQSNVPVDCLGFLTSVSSPQESCTAETERKDKTLAINSMHSETRDNIANPESDSYSPDRSTCVPPQTLNSQILPKEEALLSPGTSLKEEQWFGSDEYLALPSQLKKTEMLAIKLESLAKALPQRATEETMQDVDDWELSDLHSEWDSGLPLQTGRRYDKAFPRFSPTSSSEIAPSLNESIESGPISELLSEDEAYWNAGESHQMDRHSWLTRRPVMEGEASLHKTLIQQLLEDIQHQENYKEIWSKIENFVNKLDKFIYWLQEALETTENWTPPKAETDSLKLYLETHLSFKLSVDSHCSLKDAVLDEGRQLLQVIISHKSGSLRDTLQMIEHQWQELQRHVRRQHSWILCTLDTIKARIMTSEAWRAAPSPKGEVQQSRCEAQKDLLDQMYLKLNSHQYSTGCRRRKDFAHVSKMNPFGSYSLADFESEYQELWDWLLDMESIVIDSHELMMSEEQRQHLNKGNSIEMTTWAPKKTQLLARAESLRQSGAELPVDFEERVNLLTQKWDCLQRTLGELVQASNPSSSTTEPWGLLSPETSSMLRQLESRIKELKGWLRDTELFIFNSCLRHDHEQDPQTGKELQYFKSLCAEVRERHRGMASVLRLCQKLLEGQERAGPDSEHQALQLLTVNLERRWEAIVMQALQWQTRLQKALGTEQVPGNIIEPTFMDLHAPAEDSWEWDDMDITGDLFLSSKDTLHRSTSLESWLAPCKSTEETGSQHSLGDLGLAAESMGELSKRTLELLKRLENIKTPLAQKMARSVSDITLQSSSLQIPGPVQLSLGMASSINESSAPSLTELSSTEDTSGGSEDPAAQKNCLVVSNDTFRKHCHSQVPPDEADASISMVVNVSCTSACTDDEDDSDLLSSSTVTLTEEELGIKDDEDSSVTSDEEYIEGSFALGLEYMKNEIQNWIKPKSQSREKNEPDLGDELQCGTLSEEKKPSARSVNDHRLLGKSPLKVLESNTNEKNKSFQQQDTNYQKKEVSRSYMRQIVDDMENGNVDISQVKGKDEDDEFLREEGSLYTKTGESFKECYTSSISSGDAVMDIKCNLVDHPNSQGKKSSLERQLSGEIPCCSSSQPSANISSNGDMQGVINGSNCHEHRAFYEASVTDSPVCSRSPIPPEEEKSEDVHNFVMEIIDMASVVLKNKDQEVPSTTPVTQIRDKVLEHSHRPIQLRKGDFYSYLSLSSHDSDCGEVSTCIEDKSSTPPPPDFSHTIEIRDKEPLFKIRKCDRDEKGPASQQMKQKNVRKGCSSLQKAKSTHKQAEKMLAEDRRGPQFSMSTSNCSITCASRGQRTVQETPRPLSKRTAGSLAPSISKLPQ